jgi:hypothetical protein
MHNLPYHCRYNQLQWLGHAMIRSTVNLSKYAPGIISSQSIPYLTSTALNTDDTHSVDSESSWCDCTWLQLLA